MSITDQQVATLRALLAGRYDEHRNLHAQLDRDTDLDDYTALLASAFFDAVNRRFGKDWTDADIIEFVGNVRARSVDAGRDLAPTVAEQMIRNVLGGGSVDDLDDATVLHHQGVLLAFLILDARLGTEDLDKFLRKARALGNRLMTA